MSSQQKHNVISFYLFYAALSTSALILIGGQAFSADKIEEKSPWHVSLSSGFQIDDNVTTEETENSSGVSDTAILLDAEIGYQAYKDGISGLELGYTYSETLYNDQQEFNLQGHTLYAIGEYSFSDYDLGLSYFYTRSFLGGSNFLGLHNFVPSVGHSITDSWYLNTTYNYQRKDFVESTGNNSNVHALSFDNFVFLDEAATQYLRLTYRIEDENTNDDQRDYLGHFLTAGYKTPLSTFPFDADLNLSYQFFIKDYSSVNTTIGSERLDRRHTANINLDIPFADKYALSLNYEYIDAQSNLDSNDYSQNVITASLSVDF